MYHPNIGQRTYKPQNQAHRENDIAWQFTKILANVPLSMRELKNRSLKKSDFVIFFFIGRQESVEWNGGMEWWNGILE